MISFILKMDDEFVRLSMRVAGDRGVRQSHSHTIIYSPKNGRYSESRFFKCRNNI